MDGLRERGYHLLRSRQPGWVLIPRIDADDPLFDWLQRDLGVFMSPYRPTGHSDPEHTVYEARLHRARVEVDEAELEGLESDQRVSRLAELRALAIWHAVAAPPATRAVSVPEGDVEVRVPAAVEPPQPQPSGWTPPWRQ